MLRFGTAIAPLDSEAIGVTPTTPALTLLVSLVGCCLYRSYKPISALQFWFWPNLIVGIYALCLDLGYIAELTVEPLFSRNFACTAVFVLP